jgi:outer membrane murein-binding lipoprotein Lpp
MPTPTDIARAVTKVVKAEILSVLRALHTKIQELEAKVDALQAQVESLKQTTKTN